jgi:hypothetical protein
MKSLGTERTALALTSRLRVGNAPAHATIRLAALIVGSIMISAPCVAPAQSTVTAQKTEWSYFYKYKPSLGCFSADIAAAEA